MLGFILIFWAFFVLNTELLIRWNQVAQNGSKWQFGQVRISAHWNIPRIDVSIDLYDLSRFWRCS